MPNLVQVIVSGAKTGMTIVVPFSHATGLQFYLRNGIPTDQPVIYKVPKYEVRIVGGSSYDAVRFGLQNRGGGVPAEALICDAGLSQPLVCTPSWVPGYSP